MQMTNAFWCGHWFWCLHRWLGWVFALPGSRRSGRHRFLCQYDVAYWRRGSAVCALYAAAWLLWVNISKPYMPRPLPYLLVLNPLEAATAAIVWQGFRWLRAWLFESWPATIRRQALIAPVLLAFIALSAGVMRVWHFWGDVEWDMATLLASFGLQASLSIVWAAVAIVLMVMGNQKRQRNLWLVGAVLMGVVVVKLFLVELGDRGGVAHIVSFICVGVLLLLVGWFAPVPPKVNPDGGNKP